MVIKINPFLVRNLKINLCYIYGVKYCIKRGWDIIK